MCIVVIVCIVVILSVIVLCVGRVTLDYISNRTAV